MTLFKDITTFKVGGEIKSLVRAATADDFVAAVARCRAAHAPYLIVGGGSNILARDEGYDGTVIIPTFSIITVSGETLTADAGASWDAVVHESINHNLWGIENLSGIPGTVGGAAVANIGAYGAALSDVLVSVDVYDAVEDVRKTFTKAECGVGYRTTIFKKEPERYAIFSITLQLSSTPRPNLEYRDLAQKFAGSSPTLSDIRAAVIAIRAKKFPDLAVYGTAGSFFLNPIVSVEETKAMEARFPGIPTFMLPEGGVKVPLAWILDHVANVKGMREGSAMVWEPQPLVIATEKNAYAHDVRTLAEKISRIVKEKTSLDIFPEVRVL